MTLRAALATVLAVGAALLAGCSAVASDGGNGLGGGPTAGTPGRISVVAGENFWGNIASQIGGDRVAVTSIISDPSADPHEYEATVHDAAVIADARIVIENGVAYDDFVKRLVTAGHRHDLSVLNVGNLVGASSDANPHLWYNPAYVEQAARAIEVLLAKADPAHTSSYQANLATFLKGEQAVVDTIAAIKAKYAGTPVGYTERVPGYLVTAAGLRLGTPAAFSVALEEGNDPNPLDSTHFENALRDRTVKALLYNAQVTDSVTSHLRDLAKSSGVPIVGVTENLPAGKDFQTWQADQAKALLAALDGR